MKGRDTETPSGPPRTVRPIAYRTCQPQIHGSKWDKAAYELHREKLKSAKSTLNTGPPKIYSHLVLKMKNLQVEEQRARQMKRENDINAAKIALIARTRGRVDNWNNYERKSLGERRRQLEQLRIAKENERILFNLSQCRSHYAQRSCQEDWLKTLKVMNSIAHYPRDRTSQQKGQRNPVSAAATTHSTARNTAEGKTAKTRGKEEERSSRITSPEAKAPEKHINAPENDAS